MTFHPDWIVPDWPAPANVRALCSSRAGGVSRPPYDSLNLGLHVGDDPGAVLANRQLLQEAMVAKPVFLNQVHGTATLALTAQTPDGAEADACMSSEPKLACTIMVADCLPVLLTDTHGRAVAAAHAGWRGLAGLAGQGVLESLAQAFRGVDHGANHADDHGAESAELLVWLGPCIGRQAFEVGAEVRSAFCDHDVWAAQHFQALGSGKFLADLAALARQRLRALGVKHIYGNDSNPAWCTVNQAARYFSHRRDSLALGASGRFAACIWLDN